MTDYGFIKLSPETVYYHITHWKAGSQWMLAILNAAFKSAVVAPEVNLEHMLGHPPQPGKIYPCCYVSQTRYAALNVPACARRIVIIRDLRDTLVSGYFSMRDSHDPNEAVAKLRAFLKAVSMEEGLIHMMDRWLLPSADIQRSWLYAGERVARLEDFMSKPAEALQSILNAGWGVQITSSQARKLIRHHSYERYSKGRKPGQEDSSSHYRKGIHGDWRNYFTPRVIDEFKKRFNQVIRKSGYETSPDW